MTSWDTCKVGMTHFGISKDDEYLSRIENTRVELTIKQGKIPDGTESVFFSLNLLKLVRCTAYNTLGC